MDIEAFVSQVLADQTAPLPDSLPDDEADALVERLKSEADRHWRIDAHVSLRCADVIVHVGQTLENSPVVALGLMARGDALKLLNQTEEAWETLESAGALYLSIGDEVGWARTRIGRLAICVNLNRVDVALHEAEQAREIFLRHGEQEKLLRLNLNTAVVFDLLGQYQEALSHYQVALGLAESLGEAAQSRLGMLYINMGYAEQGLSNLHQALAYYERAHSILEERRETAGVAIAELNIATVAQAQGQYRKALHHLHTVGHLLVTQLPSEAASAQRAMIECYLSLNRYQEARDLANNLIEQHSKDETNYDLARLYLYLATAEAELFNIEAAIRALDAGEAILSILKAERWIADIHLQRGRIALLQGDLDRAHFEAVAASSYFHSTQQQADYATATLLSGQINLAEGNVEQAEKAGQLVIRIARQCHIPSLQYSAHLLLGQVAEKRQCFKLAVRHYWMATAIINRVQNDLTITLRPAFLEDKQDASRSLIRLYMGAGQVNCAFASLEQTKAQLWLSYLSNRQQLRWIQDDPYTQPLIEELNRLREEHHWFYRLAHDQTFREVQRVRIQPQQAVHEVADRERRMRSLTERLYLYNGSGEYKQTYAATLEDIQSKISENALLVEFYSDGVSMWAFSLDRETIQVQMIPTTPEAISKLVGQLQANFARALRVGAYAQPAQTLVNLAVQILHQLYTVLITPLLERMVGYERLILVPYGVLHYLPFHLLNNGEKYLLESYEIVVLPAAELLTHVVPQRGGGALVLAHTWEDRLPNTVAEAELVSQHLNGTLHINGKANQSVFAMPPSQVLHIAAHGQYRIDQPDFSYIQLGDGQLLTDDLLQFDLSYELVTLSACETGRANVAAGDELIGLGRGFLYAGAGALVASLWRVDDTVTVQWMDKFYGALQSGQSKAAALRFASLNILGEQPGLHPAFWGAFQLIGNAEPLSTFATD
jgi:CHAT domain-containing protein